MAERRKLKRATWRKITSSMADDYLQTDIYGCRQDKIEILATHY
jgi:hypothetical protein